MKLEVEIRDEAAEVGRGQTSKLFLNTIRKFWHCELLTS